MSTEVTVRFRVEGEDVDEEDFEKDLEVWLADFHPTIIEDIEVLEVEEV